MIWHWLPLWPHFLILSLVLTPVAQVSLLFLQHYVHSSFIAVAFAFPSAWNPLLPDISMAHLLSIPICDQLSLQLKRDFCEKFSLNRMSSSHSLFPYSNFSPFIYHHLTHTFFGGGAGVWTQGLHLEPLCQLFIVKGFFWDSVPLTIFSGWLWTVILLIFASWVARITGVSH
jgi:hypothetical protein